MQIHSINPKIRFPGELFSRHCSRKPITLHSPFFNKLKRKSLSKFHISQSCDKAIGCYTFTAVKNRVRTVFKSIQPSYHYVTARIKDT